MGKSKSMIALAIVEDEKIFVLKEGHNWHLPYSYLDLSRNESDEACAGKTFSGYFPDARGNAGFYGSFLKDSPFFMSRIYLVKSQGEVLKRSGQYGRWLAEPICPNISPLTLTVMRALKHDKLLNWQDRYVSTHNHPRKVEDSKTEIVRPTMKQIKSVQDRIPLEERIE